MNKAAAPGPGGGARSGEDRRRSQRVLLRVAVTVLATVQGKPIRVSAFTVSVNDHGALLLCPQMFLAGARFDLENDRTGEVQPCRTTRPPADTGDGYHVPVEFEKSAPNFWRISFPPPDWRPPE